MDYKEILLSQIIKEYLKNNQPIGSESLKLTLGIDISSATIRNYFKVLSNNGILKKSHTSSGRIPTELALKNHWRKILNPTLEMPLKDLNKLKDLGSHFGFFIQIKIISANFLQKVVNVQNDFLILAFSEGEIVLKYTPHLEKFSKKLIGLDIETIQSLCWQVCAIDMLNKLMQLRQLTQCIHVFGIANLSHFFNFTNDAIILELLSGKILDICPYGLYFDGFVPKSCLAILQSLKINGKSAKMLCLGNIYKDFNAFYTELAS